MNYNKEAVETLAKIWDVQEEYAMQTWERMHPGQLVSIIFELICDFKFDQIQQKINVFADGYRSNQVLKCIKSLLKAHNDDTLMKMINDEIPDYEELVKNY